MSNMPHSNTEDLFPPEIKLKLCGNNNWSAILQTSITEALDVSGIVMLTLNILNNNEDINSYDRISLIIGMLGITIGRLLYTGRFYGKEVNKILKALLEHSENQQIKLAKQAEGDLTRQNEWRHHSQSLLTHKDNLFRISTMGYSLWGAGMSAIMFSDQLTLGFLLNYLGIKIEELAYSLNSIATKDAAHKIALQETSNPLISASTKRSDQQISILKQPLPTISKTSFITDNADKLLTHFLTTIGIVTLLQAPNNINDVDNLMQRLLPAIGASLFYFKWGIQGAFLARERSYMIESRLLKIDLSFKAELGQHERKLLEAKVNKQLTDERYEKENRLCGEIRSELEKRPAAGLRRRDPGRYLTPMMLGTASLSLFFIAVIFDNNNRAFVGTPSFLMGMFVSLVYAVANSTRSRTAATEELMKAKRIALQRYGEEVLPDNNGGASARFFDQQTSPSQQIVLRTVDDEHVSDDEKTYSHGNH